MLIWEIFVDVFEGATEGVGLCNVDFAIGLDVAGCENVGVFTGYAVLLAQPAMEHMNKTEHMKNVRASFLSIWLHSSYNPLPSAVYLFPTELLL